MAKFLFNSESITLSSTGSYEIVDVTAFVPAAATAVLLRIKVTGATNYKWACRPVGGTNDFYYDTRAGSGTDYIVAIDANDQFEFKRENAAVTLELAGYFTTDVTMFTNGFDHSLAVTGSYQDVDVSANVPSGAEFALIEMYVNTDSNTPDLGYRAKGSSLAAVAPFQNIHHMAIVPLDSNRIFQAHISSTTIKFHLVGYITAGSHDGTEYLLNPSATNTFEVADATADSAYTSGDVAAILYPVQPSGVTNNDNYFGQRSWRLDRPDDIATRFNMGMQVVPLRDDGTYIHNRSGTNVQFYIMGYLNQDDGNGIPADDQIIQLDEPIDITPDSTGWQEVDLSSYLSTTADIVEIRVVNISATTAREFGGRPAGLSDVDLRADSFQDQTKRLYVPVGAGDKIDLYMENQQDLMFFLIGWFSSNITESADLVDITSSLNTSGWQSLDLSSQITDNSAVWAILAAETGASATTFGTRKPGSSDSVTKQQTSLEYYMAPLTNRQTEVYRVAGGVNVYYIGAILTGSSFTSLVTKNNASSGAFQVIDLTSDSPPSADIVAAVFNPVTSGATTGSKEMRELSETHRFLRTDAQNTGHVAVIIDVAGDRVEAYAADHTTSNFDLHGWITGTAFTPPVGSTGNLSEAIESLTMTATGIGGSGGSGSGTLTLGLTAQAWGLTLTLPPLLLAGGGFWTFSGGAESLQLQLSLTSPATGTSAQSDAALELPVVSEGEDAPTDPVTGETRSFLSITAFDGLTGEVATFSETLAISMEDSSGNFSGNASMTMQLNINASDVGAGIVGRTRKEGQFLELELELTSMTALFGASGTFEETLLIEQPAAATGENGGLSSVSAQTLVIKMGATSGGVAAFGTTPTLTLSVSGVLTGQANVVDITDVIPGSIAAISDNVLVVNTRNNAITAYNDNYKFNSFAFFNGVYFGVNENGIFRLDASDDAGTAIPVILDLGLNDINATNNKRFTDAYFGMRGSGDYKLSLTPDEGTTRSYTFKEEEDKLRTVKRATAKGPKGRYWRVKFENVSGSKIDLESMLFTLSVVGRKKL